MKRVILWLILLALLLTALVACYPWQPGAFWSPLWSEWGGNGPGTISWWWRFWR